MTIRRAALFSGGSGEWETPPEFFEALNREFNFTLDPCATPENAKCPTYYTEEQDGLRQPWSGRVYVNSPYGRGISEWLRKAIEETGRGAEVVVFLLPARTDTAWFHDYVLSRAEVRFLRGRIRFVGAEAPAPFPSMIVIYRRREGAGSEENKTGGSRARAAPPLG